MAIKDVLLVAVISRFLIGLFVLKTGYVINAIVVAVETETVTVTEGGNVTLNCFYSLSNEVNNRTVTYKLDSVEWYLKQTGSSRKSKIFKKEHDSPARNYGEFENRIVYIGSDENDGSITVSGLRPQDDGEYICEVYTDFDSGIHYISKNSTFVHVQVPPSLPIIEGVPIEVYTSETISLYCSADLGKPLGEMTWFKRLANGRLINLGPGSPQADLNGRAMENTSVLRITVGMADNGAMFKCTVNNSAVDGDPPSALTHAIRVAERVNPPTTAANVKETTTSYSTSQETSSPTPSQFEETVEEKTPLPTTEPPYTTPPSTPVMTSIPNGCSQKLSPGTKLTIFCYTDLGIPKGVLGWEKRSREGKPLEISGHMEDYYQHQYIGNPAEMLSKNSGRSIRLVSILTDILRTEDNKSQFFCSVSQGKTRVVSTLTVRFGGQCNCPEARNTTVTKIDDKGAIIAAVVLGSAMFLLVVTTCLFVILRLRQGRSDGKFLLDLPVHPQVRPSETRQPAPVPRVDEVSNGESRYVPPSPIQTPRTPLNNDEHVYFEINNGEVRPSTCTNNSSNATTGAVGYAPMGPQYEEPICCDRKNCKHKPRHDYFVLEELSDKKHLTEKKC